MSLKNISCKMSPYYLLRNKYFKQTKNKRSVNFLSNPGLSKVHLYIWRNTCHRTVFCLVSFVVFFPVLSNFQTPPANGKEKQQKEAGNEKKQNNNKRATPDGTERINPSKDRQTERNVLGGGLPSPSATPSAQPPLQLRFLLCLPLLSKTIFYLCVVTFTCPQPTPLFSTTEPTPGDLGTNFV